MSLIVVEGSNGSGKTEIIKLIKEKYNIIDKKSIPDWFRGVINFARQCPDKLQKEIYLYGHDVNFQECLSEKDYVFDRYAYSTIIRLNYALGMSVEGTISEILNYKNKPDLVIILKSNKEKIQERLNSRNGFKFNEDFYNYENKIYEYISNISDIMYIVNNNANLEDTFNMVSNVIDQKTYVRKKSVYERRI